MRFRRPICTQCRQARDSLSLAWPDSLQVTEHRPISLTAYAKLASKKYNAGIFVNVDERPTNFAANANNKLTLKPPPAQYSPPFVHSICVTSSFFVDVEAFIARMSLALF
jgi:hypothetical protein